MRTLSHWRILSALVASVLCVVCASAGGQSPEEPTQPVHASRTGRVNQAVESPKVLILCSYERAAASTRFQEDAIRKVIETQFPFARVRSDYFTMVTDAVDTLSPEVKQSMGRTMMLKHGTESWDLVFCVDTLAFEILTTFCRDLLGKTPLVFSGLVWDANRVKEMNLDATGVFERIDLKGTVALAKRLTPGIERFLLVAHGSEFGRRLRREVDPQIEELKTTTQISIATSRTHADLGREISSLGPKSAVIYLSFYDSTPGVEDPWGMRTDYPVPVFGVFESYLTPNMLGGCMVNARAEGKAAGEIGVRVLRGTPARSIAPDTTSAKSLVVNYPAMQRWNIPDSRVPAEARIVGAPAPWHDRYRPYLGWIVLATAVQGAIIGLLLVQRQRRRRVEAELIASKERFELAMRNSTEGVWDWDIASDEVTWSGILREQLGLTETLSSSRMGPTREWEKRVHPDDLPATRQALQAHIERATPYDVLYRLRIADGTYRWFRSRGAVQRDQAGKPVRMAGAMTDVHEQVEAERRVRESEARFRALFERNLEATFIVTDTGQILDANKAGVDLSGLEHDRLVSRRVQDFEAPPGRNSATSAFHAYFQGSPRGSFAFSRGSDGAVVEVEFSAAPLTGNQHMVILRDVTERLRIERELSDREEMYRLATESGRISVWAVETKGMTIRADALLIEQLTGDRNTDLGDQAENWFGPVHPQDLPVVHEQFRKCISGEIDEYELVIRSVWRNGDTRWLNVRAVAQRRADRSVWRVLGTALDVTERELAFEDLRHTQERLAAITDNVPGLVYRSIQTPDGRQHIEYVSQGAKDVIGIEASELVGRTIDPRDLVEPVDASKLLDAASIPVGTRGNRQVAYRLRTPAGKVRWVRDLSRYWCREDGKVVWDGIIIDQTEVREAAERLAESEKRYRNIVETAVEGIWLVGPDWATTFVNARMAGMLGYAPEDMIGKRIDEFMDDEGRVIADVNKRRREQGITEQHEFKFVRKDGSPLWTLIATNALFDDDRVFQGALAMITDISARRDMEQALLRERSLFLGGPAIAWRWRNAEGWPVEYVSANVSSLGYSAEDFTSGRISFAGIVHPDDLDRVADEVAGHVAARAVGFEQDYRIRAADGRWRWIADRTVIEYDQSGRATHFSGYTIDSTERMLAEQRLRESEQRLRLLVQSTPLGVIYFNREFTVTQWNPAAERIFGFSAEEVIGRNANFLIPPDVRPYVSEVWNNLLKQRGGTRGTNQNLRKDGTTIFCEWYNTPLVDDLGRVIGVASVVEDVTERREAQRRQEMLMVELDHRVKNNLAAVMSLAEQTGRTAPDYQTFITAFAGRLRAMAQMHKLLANSRWQGVEIGVLIRQTVETYAPGGSERATFEGPDIVLGPRASQVLAMTFNELGTNATKYGALSEPRGKVRVSWSVSPSIHDSPETLSIRWQESDGPRVSPPTRRGLGSAFIEGAVAHELGGSVELTFPDTGVLCTLEIPLAAATATGSLHQKNPES